MRTVDRNTSEADRGPAKRKGYDWSNTAPVKAVILCPQLKSARSKSSRHKTSRNRSIPPQADSALEPQARLREAEGLAQAIDLDIRHSGLVMVNTPRPATLFGSGKVEELRGLILAEKAEVVVVDHPLSPVQQRNLEKAWSAKVLDRTGLILEIFGERAHTREGRLQVDLAHLTYQKSRLVRSWTHLERQRGGVGFMGGPGERQIESDRRMIQERINAITREIETVKRTRKLHREGRARIPYPVVALVGYTNAGKSTLFNTLTDSNVVAEDMLFATLDPTMREVKLPGGSKVILSDTVGFISSLPTDLVAAFRATLEEVVEADLILLVRDMADENHAAQHADVISILDDLEVATGEADGKIIEVWNKIDLLDASDLEELKQLAARNETPAICISAETGEGMNTLLSTVEDRLNSAHVTLDLTLAPSQGSLANWLHENGEVLERVPDESGQTSYRVRLSKAKHASLLRKLAKLKPQNSSAA